MMFIRLRRFVNDEVTKPALDSRVSPPACAEASAGWSAILARKCILVTSLVQQLNGKIFNAISVPVIVLCFIVD
jgi:hypothetical protein